MQISHYLNVSKEWRLHFVLFLPIVLIIVAITSASTKNGPLMTWLLIVYTIMIIAIALIMVFGNTYTKELDLDRIGEAIDFNVLKELNPLALTN